MGNLDRKIGQDSKDRSISSLTSPDLILLYFLFLLPQLSCCGVGFKNLNGDLVDYATNVVVRWEEADARSACSGPQQEFHLFFAWFFEDHNQWFLFRTLMKEKNVVQSCSCSVWCRVFRWFSFGCCINAPTATV